MNVVVNTSSSKDSKISNRSWSKSLVGRSLISSVGCERRFGEAQPKSEATATAQDNGKSKASKDNNSEPATTSKQSSPTPTSRDDLAAKRAAQAQEALLSEDNLTAFTNIFGDLFQERALNRSHFLRSRSGPATSSTASADNKTTTTPPRAPGPALSTSSSKRSSSSASRKAHVRDADENGEDIFTAEDLVQAAAAVPAEVDEGVEPGEEADEDFVDLAMSDAIKLHLRCL
ncbi:hypothetical protein CF326_g8767 [Tilletia indica]|nr:hypothetical protein CF326_g8767 [Tilletia indica]